MKRTFAIGDIHGCSKTFRKLVEEGIQPTPDDEIICVGDYIDRGPDSKGVIDFILELRDRGIRVHTLRGNHEQMFLDSLGDDEAQEEWLMNGGQVTCKSFGIMDSTQIPERYLAFFSGTKYFHVAEHFIVVHAGLNFEPDDPFGDKDAMLWTRNTDVDLAKTKGRRIIHGHTPTHLKRIGMLRQTPSINIDGGCVMKHIRGMGYLVAIDLDSLELLAIKNCE